MNIEMDLGDISIFPMYLLSLDVPCERVEFIIIGAFRELGQREPDKRIRAGTGTGNQEKLVGFDK